MAVKKTNSRQMKAPTAIKPKNGFGELRAVIETPRGSRNKFAFKPEEGAFVLRKVLPAGMSFPFDFGFIPQTLAEDGDPIDVLVLMDEAAFPGCAVPIRMLGVLEAEEVEEGKKQRNDRLIAVATMSPAFGEMKSLADVGERLLKDIQQFFVTYQKLEGKQFRVIGKGSAQTAMKLLRQAHTKFKPNRAA